VRAAGSWLGGRKQSLRLFSGIAARPGDEGAGHGSCAPRPRALAQRAEMRAVPGVGLTALVSGEAASWGFSPVTTRKEGGRDAVNP